MGQFSMKICPQVDQFLMELNRCRRHRVDGVHRRLSGLQSILTEAGCQKRPSPIGSTSPCGYSTRSRQRADCRPTRRVGCRQRQRSSRKLNACIGGSGTAKPRTHGAHSSASARSRMSSGARVSPCCGCALVSQEMACLARGRQVSPRPKYTPRQLCKTIPGWPAGRHVGD
jgi:hypothetical protein